MPVLLVTLLLALTASLGAQTSRPSAQSPSNTRSRVLFLTHSAGFTHGVVRRSDGTQPALAERRLVEAARNHFEVLPTQDCAEITSENLAGYAAVVFYLKNDIFSSRRLYHYILLSHPSTDF